MKLLLLLPFLFFLSSVSAQNDTLPYYQIPDAPEDFGPGSVLSRMVDGLGFRYHWATEGLREADLAYRPTPEASSTQNTLEHLTDLSNGIKKTAQGLPITKDYDLTEMTFEEMRALTLRNLAEASDAFRGKTAEEIEDLQVVFQRGNEQSSFPIWNLLNGQLADAIYHTGQVVSFRRTSGNPIPSGVNVFMGRKRE